MRIRLRERTIKETRRGRKIQTLRNTPRKLGDYIVEEGGHSWFEHIDTGLRIRIKKVWRVDDIDTYILEDYALEGFDSPADMVEFMRNELKMEKFPPYMWAHEFVVVEDMEPRRR